MVDLSEAIKEVMATTPATDVILRTLEFRHVSFTGGPVRLVSDHGYFLYAATPNDIYGHRLTLESTASANASETVDFVACMFNFQDPDQKENELPSLNIEIDNIMFEVSQYFDSAIEHLEPMEVTYRVYLESDPTNPQTWVTGLTVNSVKSNISKVIIVAEFSDFVNKNFPGILYTSQEYQTLAQQ